MAAETTKPDLPTVIRGGCLCEGVRYEIRFAPDHDFANSSSTCQCEQCRKNTGSPMFLQHTAPASRVTFTADGTLRRYYASPGNARGFCGACGSFLFWRPDGRDNTSFAVGCFDKADLRRYGTLLADARCHLWCADTIPGVTDHLRGEKWEYDCEGEGAKLLSKD